MAKRHLLLITILIAAFALTYFLPKPSQHSFDVSDKFPSSLPGWQSQDVASELKEKNLNSIIGQLFARVYFNKYGKSLLFIVLDAGNFHNPKVCYGGSGFTSQELNDTELSLDNKVIKAQTIFLKNDLSGRLLIYWLCVDKRIVGWGEQKVIELFNSVFNQNKTRLMVRFEIPTDEDKIDESIELVKNFVTDIYSQFPEKYSAYIFGR